MFMMLLMLLLLVLLLLPHDFRQGNPKGLTAIDALLLLPFTDVDGVAAVTKLHAYAGVASVAAGAADDVSVIDDAAGCGCGATCGGWAIC